MKNGIDTTKELKEGEFIDISNQQFYIDMDKALKGDRSNTNVFKKMGMLGRCLHNLIMCGSITGQQAINILQLMGFEGRGINSANLRKIVRKSIAKNGHVDNKMDLPYMPVFWMKPIEDYKKSLMRAHSEIEEIRARLERKDVSRSIAIQYEYEENQNKKNIEKLRKTKPLVILHTKLKELDAMSAVNKHDYQVYLPVIKMISEVSTLILKFDEVDEDENINENLLIEQFDKLVEFIFILDKEHPGMSDRFKEFMNKVL